MKRSLIIAATILGLGLAISNTLAADKTVMVWEYKTIDLTALKKADIEAAKGALPAFDKVLEVLNKEGAEGWRLQSNFNGFMILRRTMGDTTALEYSIQSIEAELNGVPKSGDNPLRTAEAAMAGLSKCGKDGWEYVGTLAGPDRPLCMRAKDAAKRTQWEYKAVDVSAEIKPAMEAANKNGDASDLELTAKWLNKQGAEGWRLSPNGLAFGQIAIISLKRQTGGNETVEFSVQKPPEFAEGMKLVSSKGLPALANGLEAGMKSLAPEGWYINGSWRAPAFICERIKK